MKNSLLILFLLTATVVSAQKTKQEKIHFKDINCEYDTLSWLYTQSEVKIENETSKEIVITEGAKKTLFIKLFTDKCECADCGEFHHMAITVDSLKQNEAYYLKADEVKWVYGNSWSSSKYITTWMGSITMIDEKNYEIKISELLGSTVIRTINLTISLEK